MLAGSRRGAIGCSRAASPRAPIRLARSRARCDMLRIPRPIGTFIFLLAWLMPWRPAYCIRAEQSKLSFFVHRRDLIGRHIAKYGSHEPVLTRWISDYLATSSQGLFVDIGANLGWYAVHAARHTAVETVIAFEPDSFNGWLLDRNLSLNGIDNVIVNTCAVGAQRGFVRLYRYKSSNCGRHSVLTNYGYGSRLVPMTDLDTALENLGLADRPVLIVKSGGRREPDAGAGGCGDHGILAGLGPRRRLVARKHD